MKDVKYTLVIMAAGIGSRFEGSIPKQLVPVGVHQETLMELSIRDAIAAGFDKIVFVIRKDMKLLFETYARRIIKILDELLIGYTYVYQDMYDVPDIFKINNLESIKARTKPWGTGHALLACRDVIDGPFTIINADDYYGPNVFFDMMRAMVHMADNNSTHTYYMPGYELSNTILRGSDKGVTRGICLLDPESYNHDGMNVNRLVGIEEIDGITLKTERIIISHGEASRRSLDFYSTASMNMWAFTPDIFDIFMKSFRSFLRGTLLYGDRNMEFKIPEVINSLISEREIYVGVIKTDSHWMGMTYIEDLCRVKAFVEASKYMYPNPEFLSEYETRGIEDDKKDKI